VAKHLLLGIYRAGIIFGPYWLS